MSSGHSIAGTATCTGQTLVFTPDVASAAFYSAGYTLTLPVGAVSDSAGNALAVARVTRFTTDKLAVGPRLYTANSWANHDNGEEYVSQINLVDYSVTPIAFTGDNSDSYQSFVAVDAATGLVYSSGFSTTRGVDVIDMVTGARSNFELDPNPDTVEWIRGLALGPAGLYVAYENSRFASDKAIRNGPNSSLQRSMRRLIMFGLASWADAFEVATVAPALSERQLARMSPGLVRAHDRMVGCGSIGLSR